MGKGTSAQRAPLRCQTVPEGSRECFLTVHIPGFEFPLCACTADAPLLARAQFCVHSRRMVRARRALPSNAMRCPFSLSPQASQFVLFEAASGYCLFEAVEVEEIGALKAEVQASVTDLARFSKLLKLKAFQVRVTRAVVYPSTQWASGWSPQRISTWYPLACRCSPSSQRRTRSLT